MFLFFLGYLTVYVKYHPTIFRTLKVIKLPILFINLCLTFVIKKSEYPITENISQKLINIEMDKCRLRKMLGQLSPQTCSLYIF